MAEAPQPLTAHSNPSPLEGRKGGVAVFLPVGYEFDEDCRTLVPGFAVLVSIRNPKRETFRILNMYLWPGAQEDIWNALTAALPHTAPLDPSLLVVGDFNLDLAVDTPRQGSLLHRITQEWSLIRPIGPSWKGRTGTNPRTLDAGLVTLRALHDWKLTTKWSALSDHALLTFTRGYEPNTRRTACSPAKFWLLPDKARAELRRTWGFIAEALHVPASIGPVPTLTSTRPQEPGELAENDPFQDTPGLSHDPAAGESIDDTFGAVGQEVEAQLSPLLAFWGLPLTRAAFGTWWRRWRRSGPAVPPERTELARLSRETNPGPHTPSPGLASWLSSVQGPSTLSPSDAQLWLGIWTTLENAANASARYSGGPTVARPRPTGRMIAGRAVHKPIWKSSHLRTPTGEELTDPHAIGRELMGTRETIWFSNSPCLPDSSKILAAYQRQRRHGIPSQPPATLRFLRGCVLSAYGSAPGTDGEPYEVYHLHPQLFAAILQQAFLLLPNEARRDPWGLHLSHLDRVLGPSIDLLVWIPKVAGEYLSTMQRPLQLPTCRRRLFGSACARILAPALEPQLDPAQAAIAGGSCYQNISEAYKHLAQIEDPERPPFRVPHSRWICQLLFGAGFHTVMRFCLSRQRQAHPSIRRTPACLLLDQAKAFEMMAHDWLVAVLQSWGMPKWATEAFLASVSGRRLRDQLRPHWLSEVLRRGAGMGGPLSPLTWNIAFDPVMWTAQLASCSKALGYVDDLLSNIFGPGQLLLTYLVLLASTHAAGLTIEEHTCTQVSCTAGREAARAFLAPFPTGFTNEGGEGFRLRLGPTEIYRELLLSAEVLPPNVVVHTHRSNCQCKTKHAVVPAHSHRLWAEALRGTPLAPAITSQTRFLGVSLCSRTRPMEQPVHTWSRTALQVCRTLTWEKATRMCNQRCRDAISAGLSLELRTESWNTYCASTIPYPASTILPGPIELDKLTDSITVLFPTGTWAWKELPTRLAGTLGLIKGPRDPTTVAVTVAVSKAVHGSFVGPPNALWETLEWLQQLRVWVRADEEDVSLRPGILGLPSPLSVRKARRTLRGGLAHPQLADQTQLARAIYVGIWHILDKGKSRNYLHRRSRSRRWAPSEGEEWVVLSQAEKWSSAWLISRLLLDGLPGTARRRPNYLRGRVHCWGCGTLATPRWKWLSPSDNPENSTLGPSNGVAWCSNCCSSFLLAELPEPLDSTAGPATSADRLPGPPVPPTGAYTPCPLCGVGEAGSEHLVIFCKATQQAWNALETPLPHWWLGWTPPNATQDQVKRALQFSHAIAFLCCALGRSAVASAEAGCRIILQQVLGSNQPIPASAIALSRSMDPLGPINPANLSDMLQMWEFAETTPGTLERCSECCQGLPPAVHTWHGPHPDRRAAASPATSMPTLRASRSVNDGETLFVFRAQQSPAAWPFTIEGPQGRPLEDSLLPDNIEWVSARCSACQCFLLTARANREIPMGSCLCGPRPPEVLDLPQRTESEYLLSFDGGARHRSPETSLPSDGPRAVGAGAALWGPMDLRGHRNCIAQVALAVPSLSCSMHAEAIGLRSGLALVFLILGNPNGLSVVGDNLPVLRLAATNGRVRTPGIWETLEAPLMFSALQDWDCRWTAVRRHLNSTADGLATLGTHAAVNSAARGVFDPSIQLWTSCDRVISNRRTVELPWHANWPVTMSATPLFERA